MVVDWSNLECPNCGAVGQIVVDEYVGEADSIEDETLRTKCLNCGDNREADRVDIGEVFDEK